MTVFTHRKLVVLSEHKINSIECSKLTQFMLLFALAAVIGWGCFASYYVVKTESTLAGVLEEGEALSLKYAHLKQQHADEAAARQSLTHHNVNLKRDIAAMKVNMRDVTTLLDHLGDLSDARSIEACDHKTASVDDVTPIAILKGDAHIRASADIPDIDINANDVNKSIASVEKNVDRRIAAIRTAISALPASSRPSLKSLPKALRGDADGKGGPYIPETTSSSASPDLALLRTKVRYLTALELNLRAMPLALPYATDYRITSGFDTRTDPFTGKRSRHLGIDLTAGHRAPVQASADGTVLRAKHVGAYGKLVEIRHKNGFSTRYAHLDRIFVKPGDTVHRGQDIGLQGNTGRSTGSHLHYEVRYRNTPVDPKHFLKAAKHVF